MHKKISKIIFLKFFWVGFADLVENFGADLQVWSTKIEKILEKLRIIEKYREKLRKVEKN